jgi:hypothetical protein
VPVLVRRPAQAKVHRPYSFVSNQQDDNNNNKYSNNKAQQNNNNNDDHANNHDGNNNHNYNNVSATLHQTKRDRLSNLSFAQRRHEISWRLVQHGRGFQHVAVLTAAAATSDLASNVRVSSAAWVKADEAQDASCFLIGPPRMMRMGHWMCSWLVNGSNCLAI